MKKLGFGCMRLPVRAGVFDRPDKATFAKMIDRFVEEGVLLLRYGVVLS